jgi:hypothetical protein
MAYNIQEAIRQVDSIPLVEESIPELTDLANGSNPNIPGYLALGKLHQITSLAENAQTAKPPQGTIKDKTTQAAGLMALMGGRSQQAAQQSQMQQAQQPGAVPQGTPEPPMQEEAMPEDMMFAAEGGIMRADIDPDMFRFDGGGIVAFANDLDKKKQQVKEKEEEKTSTLGNMWRDIIASISNPMSQVGESVIRAGQAFGTSPGLLEELTPRQRAAKEQAAEDIRNPDAKRVLDSYLRPDQTVRNNEQNRLRASYNQQYREGNTANSPYEGKPLISPEMQQAMAAQNPPPAAPPKPRPPMGGINDGRTQIPGGNAPATGPIVPQALPENKFLTATEGFIKQQPEVFDEAKETSKINARNEAAGIGTYAKVMRDEQAKMRGQFDASRPSMSEGIVGALRAYARPGAMAGDVGGELTGQMSKERDARMQFEQDQFKVTEAIERLEEARRTGNVDKIAAAEAAVKKANTDLRNHQMTAAASAAGTLGKAQEGSLDRAQQATIEKNRLAYDYAKLAVEKAKVAAMGKDSDIMQVMKKAEALEKAGKPEEATKVLELWGQANSMKVGAKYDGKSTEPSKTDIDKALNSAYKLKNSLDFLLLSNKNAKQADKAAAQARIDATTKEVMDRLAGGTPKGGGGGAKPTFEEFMAKAKPANPNTSDAELKAYYQKNYGG